MPDKCIDCGGQLMHGAPFHEMKVRTETGTRIELRCEECAQVLARAWWPEDWGDYPVPPMATSKRVS